MTRQEKIDSGKLYQVYPDKDPDNVLFEGSKTKCQKYIQDNYKNLYHIGKIRIGKLIWEK